ncbi:MAG: hypothetical protein IID38_05270 [Planctomycetes bacterium]|nr:hypothetical protein [Planctomycetota bacterium]
MPTTPGRFSRLRWLQNALCVAALVGAAILIGLGLTGVASSPGVWMVAAGSFVLFLVILLMTFAPLLLKMESTLARQLSELRDLNEAATRQHGQLEAMVENTRISDAAKSLARRGEEIEALRGAIRADIREARWDAAIGLIDEMERRFGYKEEAESIREELDDARNDQIQSKLAEAIELIEDHFRAYRWDLAQHEIDRLLRALPDHARVVSLSDRMKAVQEQHKQELKLAWQDAVRRCDTDQAIDVLKELDQYLSPAEAKALQASARDVFKDKLLQLGVQFRFAVTERRWHDALTIGLEITHDFPNARMAGEVRDALDTLRQRARQPASASPGPVSEARS